MNFNITLLPGDGIGPEVVAEAVRVLEVITTKNNHTFHYHERLMGGCSIDRYGTSLTDETLADCQSADAILFGAVGGPKWDDPNAKDRPERGLLALRKGLCVFANLRPVKVHPALAAASPLRPELLEGVDLLIVRELTGGVYFGEREEAAAEPGGRRAVDTMPYSEEEIRRIVILAGAFALTRRRRLTSVDKANVLATSRLWRRVVDEERRRFPDVEVSHQLVDSCAMLLVRRPADFDVIVTENLFGDILSDEAAVLAGSLGMLPSASLANRLNVHGGTFGLYEPIHGSAPDIAGQDVANPTGTILSAAMMCFSSFKRPDVSAAIEAAVARAIDEGWRTADLADPANPDDGLVVVGTTAFATAVIDQLGSRVAA